ncbi:MAG: hypothetical protein QM767_23425 [Anaeromyxobacter sp.]
MRHAFKLGPLPIADEPPVFVYCSMGPGGLSAPVLERNDLAGVRALLRDGDPEQLVCAPDLEETAARLGLLIGALPQEVLVARAALAVASAVDATGPGGAAAAYGLADAFVAFCQAHPWDRFDGDVAVPLTITAGGAPHAWEASVMGMAGQEFGLCLYEQAGALARVRELFEAGQLELIRRIPSISVSLEEEPDYAAQAFEEAYGIPGAPGTRSVARGRVGRTTTRQNVILSAALLAFARLEPGQRQSAARATADELEAEAWILAAGRGGRDIGLPPPGRKALPASGPAPPCACGATVYA